MEDQVKMQDRPEIDMSQINMGTSAELPAAKARAPNKQTIVKAMMGRPALSMYLIGGEPYLGLPAQLKYVY